MSAGERKACDVKNDILYLCFFNSTDDSVQEEKPWSQERRRTRECELEEETMKSSFHFDLT
jgi:hypothetical protein